MAVIRDKLVTAQRKLTDAAARLPAEARTEIAASAKRLALAARSPSRFVTQLTEELERLLAVLVPLAARNPLPVSGKAARALAGTTAGAAAAVAEAEGLLILFSAGVAAPPGAPVVVAAWLTAWAVEVWAATSARQAQLRAAGYVPHEAVLIDEISFALGGGKLIRRNMGRRMTQRLARRIAGRLARRWAAGLAPGVGIAYDARDAQRTVKLVLDLPLDAHPRAASIPRGSPAPHSSGGWGPYPIPGRDSE